MTATRKPLPHGRWHFQHGPIDLVIGADPQGDDGADAVAAAHQAAWNTFVPLLDGLVTELGLLRQAVDPAHCGLRGPVAKTMWQACAAHAQQHFITPMAAVAGAVAQHLVACYQRPGIARAWVNNGGDIALHLAPAQALRVGLFSDLGRLPSLEQQQLPLDGHFVVQHSMPVRGIATSGWRGRSFSMGIADSVTVLAISAAAADAAASLIANAVNTDHPAIQRQPANRLRDDSDLGAREVTVAVPRLPADRVAQALEQGMALAQQLQSRRLIAAAVLACQGQHRVLALDALPTGQADAIKNSPHPARPQIAVAA